MTLKHWYGSLITLGIVLLFVGCPEEKEEATTLSEKNCEPQKGVLENGGNWQLFDCSDSVTFTLENVPDGGSFTPPVVRIGWLAEEIHSQAGAKSEGLRQVVEGLKAEGAEGENLSTENTGEREIQTEGRTIIVKWQRNEIQNLEATVTSNFSSK